MTTKRNVPSVSVTYNRKGKTAKANELGMRPCRSAPMSSAANNTA